MTLTHKVKVQLLLFSKDAKFLFSCQYLSPFKINFLLEKVFKRVFHLKIMSTKTSREIALDRRKAMSDGGKKAALNSSATQDRVRSSQDIKALGTKSSGAVNMTKSTEKQIPVISSSTKLSSKELVIERRKAMSTHGKSAINSSDRTRTEINNSSKVIPVAAIKKGDISEKKDNGITENHNANKNIKRRVSQKRKPITNTSRDIVLARREAQSKHG